MMPFIPFLPQLTGSSGQTGTTVPLPNPDSLLKQKHAPWRFILNRLPLRGMGGDHFFFASLSASLFLIHLCGAFSRWDHGPGALVSTMFPPCVYCCTSCQQCRAGHTDPAEPIPLPDARRLRQIHAFFLHTTSGSGQYRSGGTMVPVDLLA